MAETEEKRQKKQMMDGNPYKVIVCIREDINEKKKRFLSGIARIT